MPIILVALVTAVLGLVAIVTAYGRRVERKFSRTGIAVAALPPVMMLGLFYSLAIHMHQSLGAWPKSIGERGFPPLLVTHANFATSYFAALLLVSMFVLPVAILVCLLVPRWKRFVPYIALYALLFVVCWGLMQLAPEPFLYWWRD